ncbi:S-layer homology domain-containing protein [Gorillibacterium massiliense]|uniref:S-layer homology domain-containing protein n=1 Tax=Gorillibacterium massiliense TaxID=1280390 RepID=UPI000693C19C|nr:S-layer homology domain-containing protein [Gorillibacterium massiliense]
MKKVLLTLLTAVLFLTFSGSVLAFSDVKNVPGGDKIESLQKEGIVSGEPGGKFNPSGKLTNAAAISILVKGLDLSLARFLFNKAPLASDYFTDVKDNTWYSEAFIIAHINGVDLPKDMKPDAEINREQFAHYLFQAVEANGSHVYPMLFTMIADEKEITPGYSNSIQNLLHSSVIELNADSAFLPKHAVTRGEAAVWIYNAREYVKKTDVTPSKPQEPDPVFTDMSVTTKALSGGVQEVTVHAKAPHPGYGIRVSSIVFDGKKAVIYTEPILPDPDKMYAQVITEVTAVTYVATDYTPVLPESVSGQAAE